MSEVWVAGLATVAVGVYSANKASGSAKDALNAQEQGNQAAIGEQQREYNQTRADQLPFLTAGYGALDKENAFLNGDTSGFDKSPDYLFSLNQGIGALDKSAAARGSLYSGGHSADLTQFAEWNANQFANNYWNKLAGMAGQGQTTAGNLGSFGANMANNVSNLDNASGNARASSYLQQGNIAGQKAGVLGNAFNQFLGYYNNRPQTTTTPSSTGAIDWGNMDTSGLYGGSGANNGTYDVFGLGGGS